MRIREVWALVIRPVSNKSYTTHSGEIALERDMHGFDVSPFVRSIDLAHTSFFCTANNGSI